MKNKKTGVPSGMLLFACLLLALSSTVTAQDDRERLKEEIAELQARLELVAQGPAERLADQELARARAWVDQADEARTRRNLKLARMLFNNAAMDLKVAEAMVESFEKTQERKQVLGQVEALQRTVEEAQAAEEALQ